MKDKSETKRHTLSMDNVASLSMNALSVVILGGNDERRQTLAAGLSGTQAQVARQAPLPSLDELPSLLNGESDILIVDLDQHVEHGLELVEGACGLRPSLTVMVYSHEGERELLVRCMRAGAREFLTDPLSPAVVAEALVRATVRREELVRQKKNAGKCLVFVGAKGGSGVTTLAANFAVCLAKESGQNVALLDLDLRLGDAALSLGVTSEYSTMDALENESRLDSVLVSKLLMRHSSGLQVLAAPDEYNTYSPSASAVIKLVNILRNDFAYLVVDTSTRYNGYGQSLFELADKVYLVTQVSVAELRNSNRLIAAYFKAEAGRKLEVILNRYAMRAGEIDEEGINKALQTIPAWKVPSDYHAVRQAQNTATALSLKDGPITRVLTQIARAACGKTGDSNKKRKFGLF
jgi:pilus assembly protein CpaE